MRTQGAPRASGGACFARARARLYARGYMA